MFGISWLESDGTQIVVWATISGVASMLLYRFTSPQQRLQQLEREAATARRALNEVEGDFREAWPLIRQSLALSFARVRLAFGPSLFAALPVLLAMYVMEDKLSAASVLPLGPPWIQSAWFAFFAVTAVAALAIKVALRIK